MVAVEVSEVNGTVLGVGVAVPLGVRLAVLEMQRKNQLGIRLKMEKFR